MRRVQAAGGNAVLVRRGDREAGAILILLADRGETIGVVERFPRPDGRYGWELIPREKIELKQNINDYVRRRSDTDSDMWVIDLDIPQAERFAAELTATG